LNPFSKLDFTRNGFSAAIIGREAQPLSRSAMNQVAPSTSVTKIRNL
jgi:hypothetical protein